MNKQQSDHFLALAYETFMKNSQDLMFVKDANLVYVAVSEVFAKITKVKTRELVAGKTDYDLFEPKLAEAYREDDRRVLESGIAIEDYIEPLPQKHGKKFYSSTSKYVIRDEKNCIIGMYGISKDITSKMELKKKAETDFLTGLSNRETVLEKIAEALSEVKSGQICALLFIDLDYFKEVNDCWGHQVGDAILQKTAERLQNNFREDDIVGRIGGDEFLVFIRRVNSREAVEERAKQAAETISLHGLRENGDVSVTCSVGITICQNVGMTVEELCDQADKAMYHAKEQGRNTVFFYGDSK